MTDIHMITAVGQVELQAETGKEQGMKVEVEDADEEEQHK